MVKKGIAALLSVGLLASPVHVTEAKTANAPYLMYQITTATGFVNGSGDEYATAYVYRGNVKLGSTKTSKYGYFHIPISAPKKGQVLTVFTVKNGVKSKVIKFKVTKTNTKVKQKSLKKFTTEDKNKINKEMYRYLAAYAKKHKKAVSDYYFSHGSAGYGDWYAITDQGSVQTQDNNYPGYYGFPLHDVGGFIMYTPKSGQYGIERNHYEKITGFGGLHELYKPNTSAVKYMMADNGKVYEIKGTTNNTSGLYIHPATGFGELTDKGTYGQYGPTVKFKPTTNKALQQKYTSVIKKYVKK